MPHAGLEKLLSVSPPAVRELALHARVLVLKRHPEAVEKVWTASHMIGYGLGPGMRHLVCGIVPRKDRIQLYFRHGAALPDPAKLLRGRSRTARYADVHAKAALEADALHALIRHAFAQQARTAPARSRREPRPAAPLPAPIESGEESGRVAASKTVTVPVDLLYDAWADARRRRRWLSEPRFTVRKTTPGRSLRIAWSDDTEIEVQFHSKGLERSQVTVDHREIAPRDVPRVKEYWSEQLARLKEVLES
jgi:hypothetical protein